MALLAAIWDKAIKGSVFHVDRCLAIMERRAKLLGLDKPLQHILAGDKKNPVEVAHQHGIDQALLERMNRLAGLDSSGAAQPAQAEVKS
jgi:hypothetical protein